VQPTATVQPTAPPPTVTCPTATGQLSGIRLGPLALGLTRRQAQHTLPHFAEMSNHFQNFCLHAGPGIRVAYSSPHLLASLAAAHQSALSNRIVIALTANPFYALHGARAGTRLVKVRTQLKLGQPLHIGLNYWYVTPGTASNGVLKVRHGIIQEIGIANKTLTQGRRAQARFLASGF
jgi:hypothetical protein